MNDDLCLSVHCMHISTQELGEPVGMVSLLPSLKHFINIDFLRLLCRPFLDQKFYQSACGVLSHFTMT